MLVRCVDCGIWVDPARCTLATDPDAGAGRPSSSTAREKLTPKPETASLASRYHLHGRGGRSRCAATCHLPQVLIIHYCRGTPPVWVALLILKLTDRVLGCLDARVRSGEDTFSSFRTTDVRSKVKVPYGKRTSTPSFQKRNCLSL